MGIKKFSAFLVLWALSCALPSNAREAVTWEWCLEQAREHNPELAAARENVTQALADKDIRLSVALPLIDATAAATRGKTHGGKMADTYSYGISGRQLLFDGYRTASEVTGALKTARAEWYRHALVSSNVRLELRAAFVSLLRAQEMVEITENIARRRKQNYELVELRYKGGREHRGALLTAEADLAQAGFEVEQAERSIILANRALAGQLGTRPEELFRAEGSFSLGEEYPARPDMESLADATPFLQELISRKEAAKYDVNAREAEFMPRVYLTGAFSRFDDDILPRKDDWSAGLSLSFPVFEGGRRVFELSRARSRLAQSGYETRSGRDTVLVALERTWNDLMDAVTRVSVREKFLEAAEERAKITSAQYSTGLVSFNDWIIIEDNLVNARKAYINARADMLIAEAYWIQAIGGTLEYD